MLNRCEFIGRLTKDAEITISTTGKKVARFNLAVGRGKKNGQDLGADYIPCTAWEGKADIFEQWIRKGDAIYVSGVWRTSPRPNNQGLYHSLNILEVQFLPSNKRDGQMSAESETNVQADDGQMSIDDDLPF